MLLILSILNWFFPKLVEIPTICPYCSYYLSEGWYWKMDDVVKLLDENLRYISHEIVENTLFIRVASEKLSLTCPSCGAASAKVHSRYERTFHDLPIQGKKVVYVINNRKMFCHNAQCHRKTFAEQFLFLPYKAKKSTRLEQEIMKIAQNVSSLAANSRNCIICSRFARDINTFYCDSITSSKCTTRSSTSKV